MFRLRLAFHAFVVLLVAAIGLVLADAQAATRITSVARIAWNEGGTARFLDSNSVAIDVVEDDQATLTTFRADPASPLRTDIRAPLCVRSEAVSAAAPSAPAISSTAIIATNAVRAGDLLIFKLVSPTDNRDPRVVDALSATIFSRGGDRETLTIYENGADTGVFVGRIATSGDSARAVSGDCTLAVIAGTQVLIESYRTGSQRVLATAALDVLDNPHGVVFDSDDGKPVSGVRVTLIDDANGRPASVFAPDGVTSWPATVVSGATVTDSGGRVHALRVGEYQFPRIRPGRYRLAVEPPAPFAASTATAAQLTGLSRPDGSPLTIQPGSYGTAFSIADPGPIGLDLPIDRPASAVALTKVASRGIAAPGDIVLYTVTLRNADATHAKRGVTLVDQLPDAMRLRAGSVRVDGVDIADAVTPSADGRRLTVAIGALAAGAARTITYALEVRVDARAGQAINRATATDARGTEVLASAMVRITSETIAARMTVIGRVVEVGCDAKPPFARGVAGVRVMLEDGSYAVTDRDGRYHFEGVVPGAHVVQVDPATLGAGGRFVDCTRSTRSAGSATSRFVEGQGGSLVIADFHAVLAPGTAATADTTIPTALSDKAAAGAERDWFAGGTATVDWLFPEADHNPRAPAVRVAIRHLVGQKVTLLADGKPVDPIAYDGQRPDPTGSFAVSLWRGVPLAPGATRLSAEVRGADGALATTLTREIYFTATAARAQYLPEKSRLVADGVQRPVIAVRMVDRAGRPLHAGSVGELALSAPYVAAAQIDAEQARMLSGLERAAPTWRVAGDDGIAYIALAPTTTSGALTLDFAFSDREQRRRQKVETWLSPGDRAWTIVGLAQGKIGRHVEPLAAGDDSVVADGRVAFYAKGRVLGRWLLTLAYDSAKRRDDQRLTGAIDPNTYYTVYADRSERRFDAASTRKLYVKLERRQFYALFGDFETGYTDTELGRYVRAATGLKAEYRGRRIGASAFAAEVATRHRRDEIQGNGLSGLYALSARDIVANSEQVAIEVRDRLRSEKIVERRTLTRFVDYDLDYAAGTIRFSSPILSRTSALDPQFIIVDFEVDQLTGGETNAGARATWNTADERIRLGATVLRDADDTGRTTIAAADARVRIGDASEIRAEIAGSRTDGVSGVAAAWLVEAEHHDTNVDVLAYARQQDADYGVAQQNGAERGRRKIGVDGRLRLTDALSLSGGAWTDDDLLSDARRRAVRARVEYRGVSTDLRLGIAHAADRTDAVESAVSTLIEAGATQRLMNNRLEVDAATSFALGRAESVDFPAQHRLGARFKVTPDVTLVGAYEIATGDAVAARTARVGFELKPWAGARLSSAVADQDIAEYGRRAYAAYGLAQSLQLGPKWSIDATVDGTRTLRGIDAGAVVNPAQPAASGGFVGSGNTITEDFTALTLGATYRAKAWSGTARAEYRFGQFGDRAGATLGVIRQLGDGAAVGALATWTRAKQIAGATTETLDVAGSAALRPVASRLAMLGKLAWREDRITNATAGLAGPVGGSPLTVTGDARSRRLVASLSTAWAPYGRDENGAYQRHEVNLFVGTRYVFDRIDAFDLAGLTTMVGADARLGIGDRFELGVSGTVRGDLGRGTLAYSVGPTVGVRPAKNMLVTAGWNLSGFVDRDFEGARTTRDGPFVAMKLKFDQDSFSFLGLGRR